MAASKAKPVFFRDTAALRKWFERHGSAQSELWIGFYNAKSAKRAVSYKEALDEALCYGWIDGVRMKVDDETYTNRFSPRKAKSNWSEINIKRAHELIAEGRMAPPGTTAFERRDENKTKEYSHEARNRPLEPQYDRIVRKNKRASAFVDAQTPATRRLIAWWIMSAKQEDTRLKRIGVLIEHAERGELPKGFLQPKR